MAGDFSRLYAIYGGSNADVTVPAVTPILVTVTATTKRIYVLQIKFTPTTYANATLKFLDSLTGASIGSLTIPPVANASGTSDQFILDFSPAGTPLSVGANLLLGVTGGAAGRLHVDAVQKPR